MRTKAHCQDTSSNQNNKDILTGQKILPQLLNVFRLPAWYAQRLHHRDPQLWIFGAWAGLRYSDSSRALFEYVAAHCSAIRPVWITRSDEVLRKVRSLGFSAEHVASEEGRRVMKRAGFCFVVQGPIDVDGRYLNGCRIINMWHGMPLKQIGEDQMRFVRRNTWWKRFKTAIRHVILPYEFLPIETLSTSPFFTPFLRSAFQLPAEKIYELGLPRNDHFFCKESEPLIRSIDERFGHPVKVMYMPTFRDVISFNGHPFNPFDYGFDQAQMEAVLERRNMVLIYKGHFIDRTSHGFSDGRILTVTDDDYDNLYRFVKDMDVLITDYSGIYFDYLLLRRPIILFPFDEEDYRTRSRPFYFDYGLMEARRVYTWADLADCLDRGDYYPPSDTEVRRFHRYPDGDSCRRLVEVMSRTIAVQ